MSGTKGRAEGGQLPGCWPFPKPCGGLAPLGSVQVAPRPLSPGRHVEVTYSLVSQVLTCRPQLDSYRASQAGPQETPRCQSPAGGTHSSHLRQWYGGQSCSLRGSISGTRSAALPHCTPVLCPWLAFSCPLLGPAGAGPCFCGSTGHSAGVGFLGVGASNKHLSFCRLYT